MTKKTQPSKTPNAWTELQKLGQQIDGQVKKLKKQYDQMDQKTKQTVFAGLAGVATILAGAIATKKIVSKKKKK